MFQCVSGCNQSLPNTANIVSIVRNNWTMAWVVMFPQYNAGFAYDQGAIIPAGWNHPYPWYANEPLGVYSAVPHVTVNNTYFYTANSFQAGKYVFGSPQENLTLSVNLYQVPENDTTTFWAFGYNPNMVTLTQSIKPIQTSYIVITPNADSKTSCVFTVPSSSNETCGKADPSIAYISTNNAIDDWATSIYSALDNNTGQMAWVFETGYHDSVLAISNNQISSNVGSFAPNTPTGVAFDSKNNLAYITYGIPTDCNSCPHSLTAISGNKIVSTPVSSNLQGWPAGIAYDQHYDYLYVSYAIHGMNINQGIGIFNPNNGTQLAYIPTDNGNPTTFAYDPTNGDMFAAVPQYAGSNTTIYVMSGLSVTSRFNVTGTMSSMIYDVDNGYLYLAQQNGDIVIVNPSSDNTVGIVYSSSPLPSVSMIYDTSNEYVYAFEPGEMLVISGTTVVSNTSIPYTVTSAQYNPRYGNILAFY